MCLSEVQEYLNDKTEIVSLRLGDSTVLVAPCWCGRVMTSACNESGEDFGWINRGHIDWGGSDPRFNNYGGEERMWLSPEGGQFSLWFKPGAEQVYENWYTPPALNETPFEVSRQTETSVGMTTRMELENASAIRFALDVTRDVEIVDRPKIAAWFDKAVAEMIDGMTLDVVGYQTTGTVTNTGDSWTRDGGLISIWILSQLQAAPNMRIVMPVRRGSVEELGPVAKSDYFGDIPADRISVTEEGVTLQADGSFRAKIGTSPARTVGVIGAVDMQAGRLTLARFDMPEQPEASIYMDNMWGGPHTNPFVGDAANAYNDGAGEGGGTPSFFELESLSPTQELNTGESIRHSHCTAHFLGDPDEIRTLCHAALGIDPEGLS